MNIECYAQRLLNPFRGVMNIIEYRGAEAVTTDGIHWDIYVRDDELVADLNNSHKIQTSDIRYGNWSARDGLKRGAIYPSEDFRILEHRGAIVFEDLLRQHTEVPFPLRDNIELWLLDVHSAPLALLDSVVRAKDIELDCPLDWRAGQECRKHFQANAMQQLSEAENTGIGAGDYLTRYINGRAGDTPRAQWFRRLPDGRGEGLRGINLPRELEARSLPDHVFPPYFLSDADSAPRHRQLIQEFIDWQAPWLLLLQNLMPAARQRFERLARSRALAVEKHYHLYPDIVDHDPLTAARVEAALRKNQAQDEDADEAMSTYYIELNVTRTN